MQTGNGAGGNDEEEEKDMSGARKSPTASSKGQGKWSFGLSASGALQVNNGGNVSIRRAIRTLYVRGGAAACTRTVQ